MTTEAENAQLVEEMLRRAEKAEEPGELARNPVINKGDGDFPTPMVVTELKSAGYVKLWNSKTGELSLTNRNMLRSQLSKRNEDGSFVFTTVEPGIKSYRGKLKCALHPGDPNRSVYDEMGFPICLKSNLTSKYQVRRHMQKRHPSVWEAIEEERKEKEKDEEKKLRHSLLKSAKKSKNK